MDKSLRCGLCGSIIIDLAAAITFSDLTDTLGIPGLGAQELLNCIKVLQQDGSRSELNIYSLVCSNCQIIIISDGAGLN